jgi:hypothetical protein
LFVGVRIGEIAATYDGIDGEYVCECATSGCRLTLRLSLDEFDDAIATLGSRIVARVHGRGRRRSLR